MGPKIGAALDYLERGGTDVIITALDRMQDALRGNAGTRIVP
jgi:carbamate kinase